jgi:TolB-like protein/Flp pilus assembly protein TadD
VRYRFESCVLDTGLRELHREGNAVSLAPQVFDLLVFLIQNKERVVSKDDLTATIWNGRAVSDSAVTTRINAARIAIGDDGKQQRLIRTLSRKGFRFVGEVREELESPAAAGRDPQAGAPGSPLALPEKPSIAVLPFTVMGADREQEYFADGMAEEIITALSRCNWLFVIARNSSFTYKGGVTDVRRVGRELGVRYVLEGSVRRAGNRLRITGQLVDALSGAHLWAERFEGDTRDVFDLQDRVTEAVVGAIEPKLQFAEIERLKNKPVPDLDAYDLLLRAQALEYEYTEESLEAALRCLDQAIAIDPSYAPAMALAAYCHAERRQQGWSKDAAAETAEGLRLALRALERGKDDPNVLWMVAFAVRVLGSDAHRARELVSRSLELNPNSAIALTTAGWAETFLANPTKALELLARAERLSPRDPKAWYMAAAAALAHFVAGQFDLAIASARKALAQNPRFAPTLRVLAASLARLGDIDGAGRAVRELLGLEPHLTVQILRARMAHMDDSALGPFMEALRIAGLPDSSVGELSSAGPLTSTQPNSD